MNSVEHERLRSKILLEQERHGRPDKPDAALYANLTRDKGFKKSDAKVLAGYSSKTPTSSIERSNGFQNALMEMEAERVRLRGKKGMRMEDILTRVEKRAKSKDVSPSDQTANDKLLLSALGYMQGVGSGFDGDGIERGATGAQIRNALTIIQNITISGGGDGDIGHAVFDPIEDADYEDA